MSIYKDNSSLFRQTLKALAIYNNQTISIK